MRHSKSLLLNGLTSLSDTAAESLSKHEGDLHLNGLTSLSDTAAEYLGMCPDTLHAKVNNWPESAAAALRSHTPDSPEEAG